MTKIEYVILPGCWSSMLDLWGVIPPPPPCCSRYALRRFGSLLNSKREGFIRLRCWSTVSAIAECARGLRRFCLCERSDHLMIGRKLAGGISIVSTPGDGERLAT